MSRYLKILLAALLLLAASVSLAGLPVEEVGPIGVTVSDLDRSLDFYRDVLDFELVATGERSGEATERLYGVFGARVRFARLRLGTEAIELIAFLAPRGRVIPPDSRSNDLWFQHIAIVTSDMQAAYERLRVHGVEHASSAPQTLPEWNPNAGGIEAFYFRDPDGNHLEILRFPEDKGHERWQRDDRLFLGIDHTAIVVDDTERSLAFYRDLLGLEVVGASENYGIEQERLNGVFGARLRITTLSAGRGPGVELLEYLAPGGGRPASIDTRPNDLWHWQTTLVVEDTDGVDQALVGARTWLVSPHFVSSQDTLGRAGEARIVRDPDGHGLLVFAPGEASP